MRKLRVTWMQYDFELHADTPRVQLFDNFWEAEDFIWNDPGELHEFGHRLPLRSEETMQEFDQDNEEWVTLIPRI